MTFQPKFVQKSLTIDTHVPLPARVTPHETCSICTVALSSIQAVSAHHSAVYAIGVVKTCCENIEKKSSLSYDVAVFQWITSCHKNLMTTRVITLRRVYIKSLTPSVSTMGFLHEIMFILKAIKIHFKRSYDKQNLTLVVVSHEIYETRRRLVS